MISKLLIILPIFTIFARIIWAILEDWENLKKTVFIILFVSLGLCGFAVQYGYVNGVTTGQPELINYGYNCFNSSYLDYMCMSGDLLLTRRSGTLRRVGESAFGFIGVISGQCHQVKAESLLYHSVGQRPTDRLSSPVLLSPERAISWLRPFRAGVIARFCFTERCPTLLIIAISEQFTP
jgi:hypothetical protein